MSKLEIIAVPYDSGRRGERMGSGPLRLLEDGLAANLASAGFDVGVNVVDLPAGVWPSEVTAAFQLANQVAQRVRAAISAGRFPLILSGNCGQAAFGAVGGMMRAPRVFWFDAHADFNTPETTVSGFFDGTSLGALCGRCWTRAHSIVEEFTPVDERSVLLIGARDLDDGEAALLGESEVRRISAARCDAELAAALTGMPRDSAYLHIDLDVLDPSEGHVNQYEAPGGLSIAELEAAVRRVAASCSVEVMALTAYDAGADPDRRMAGKAQQLIPRLLQHIQNNRI